MNLLDAAALSMLSGTTRPRAAAVFKELREHSAADGSALEDVIAVCAGDAVVDAIASAARRDAAERLQAAHAAGMAVLKWDDESYPPLLRMISDPPPVLWVRGSLAGLTRPGVAIVGSRAATAYALEVAARLGGELADRGVVVVSGLAARRRRCGASGLSGGRRGHHRRPGVRARCRVSPGASRARGKYLQGRGFGQRAGAGPPPLPEHFPLRNRLISGISLAVVVVEASDKSGSLITARYALEQGRDVMAVPGSVLGGRNRGSHALLKDGAKVVETADDILEELGWPALRSGGEPALSGLEGLGLSRVEGPGAAPGEEISSKYLRKDDLLARLTPGEAYDLDGMSATLGLTGPRLLPRLTEWEMEGRLVKVGGGRYVVAGRN